MIKKYAKQSCIGCPYLLFFIKMTLIKRELLDLAGYYFDLLTARVISFSN